MKTDTASNGFLIDSLLALECKLSQHSVLIMTSSGAQKEEREAKFNAMTTEKNALIRKILTKMDHADVNHSGSDFIG